MCVRQSIMKNFLYFLLGFLLVFLPVRYCFALTDYDQQFLNSLNYVAIPSSSATGHTYIGPGPTTFDQGTAKFDTPMLSGEFRNVPKVDPNGTLTNQRKFVADAIVASIPGTNLVQLANGTWTNQGASPSATLSAAYSAAQQAASNPTYDNSPAQECVYFSPSMSTIQGTTQNTCPNFVGGGKVIWWNTPTTKIVSTLSATKNTSSPGLGAQYTCQNYYNLVAGTVYYATSGSGSLFKCTNSPTGPNIENYPGVSGSSVNYDQSKFVPGSGVVTPSGLATALQSYQGNHSTNGLDQDYANAINKGSGTTYNSTVTTSDIDTFVTNSYNTANTTINNKVATAMTNGTDGEKGQVAAGQLNSLEQQKTNDNLENIGKKLDSINTNTGNISDQMNTASDQANYPSVDGQFDGTFSDPGQAESLTDKLTNFTNTVKASLPDISSTSITSSSPSSSISADIQILGATIPFNLDFAPYKWILNALGAIFVFFSGIFAMFIVIGRA